jgi:hypothetical protein
VDERQPFLQDDNDDTLLFQKLREHVLEKYPNPNRTGCFDRATLGVWARNPEKLDLSDPRYLHVLKCSECTRDLLELRRLYGGQREPTVARPTLSQVPPRLGWRGAIWVSAVMVCCALFAGVFYWRTRSESPKTPGIQQAAIAETIDLSNAGASRGGDTSAVTIVLPRRVVALRLVLPYFSPGGPYVVSVASDRSATSAKAKGTSVATTQGAHANLTVRLDLRNLDPGTYYLATTHEGDPSSYFYPMTVK